VKSKEIVAKMNEEINHQKIIELEKNQKLYAMDAMITGQDVERKRIAQDLHDGLGALLSTVQMHFSSIENEMKKLYELNIYNTANKLLDEACQEVRKIAHNMMPGTLLKFGLVPALQDMCNKINSTQKLQVDLHAFNMEDERMSEQVEMTVYRLVQEGLNNVVKHSSAGKATVQVLKDKEEMHVTIEDDGVGFVVQDAFEKKGMGMRNLDARVKYLNGRLDIQSEPGKGTSIVIDIPLS
jgi:signal transduction histidine kinase